VLLVLAHLLPQNNQSSPLYNSFFLLLMNNGDTPATLTLEWDTVPGLLSPQGTTVGVRDVWNHENLGDMAGAFVPATPTPSRDSIFLRLTPRTS
jgi:hypothetical protein